MRNSRNELERVSTGLRLGVDHLIDQLPDESPVAVLWVGGNQLRLSKEQFDVAIVSTKAMDRDTGNDGVLVSAPALCVFDQRIVKLAHRRILS